MTVPVGGFSLPQTPSPSPTVIPGRLPVTLPPPGLPGGSSQLQTFPAGCRDLNVNASQRSFLFHSKIYKFHQIKHWCWRKGVIYDERHAWSFDGGSTACFDEIYPDNHWTFTWWHGIAGSGDFSEERAHVTNCVFHIGDWKEFYPDVKIWAYADGTYKIATAN
ncbi:MAG TPA: hypothetical protein VFW85_02615 [Gaiellaceae bacterium]|nr:hypothetical protein [Gaiellaceae bacterium]